MIPREIRHKLNLYKAKGGKQSRRRTVKRVEEFVSWCKCSPHQIGKKHVHAFFEKMNFAPLTERDYWYAIKLLWEILERQGKPPKKDIKVESNSEGQDT